MIATHFIADALAIYYLVLGIAMIVNPKRYVTIFTEMTNSASLLVLAGIIATIIGIVIVLSHNEWEGWPLFVTLAGWLALIKGAALLILPARFLEWFKPLYKEPRIRIMGIASIVLAILFAIIGTEIPT